MTSPQEQSFQAAVLRLRGNRSQRAFAEYLNTQNPPRPVSSGYISLAEAGTRGKSGIPACPVWFVHWLCQRFRWNIPADYADRQTHEISVRRQARVKQVRQTTLPDDGSKARLLTVEQQLRASQTHATDVEKRLTQATTLIRQLREQVRALQESIDTGEPSDPYTADVIFIGSICAAVEAEIKTLNQSGQRQQAEILHHHLEAVVTAITNLLEFLGIEPNQKVREKCAA